MLNRITTTAYFTYYYFFTGTEKSNSVFCCDKADCE